jgi:hypothetical protein
VGTPLAVVAGGVFFCLFIGDFFEGIGQVELGMGVKCPIKVWYWTKGEGEGCGMSNKVVVLDKRRGRRVWNVQ